MALPRQCKNCEGAMPDTRRSNAKYCTNECGALCRSYKWRGLNGDKTRANQRESNNRRRVTPYGKFVDQRCGARLRGIEFTLTFEEWWSVWDEHYDGRGAGKLVMCRTNDKGGYTLGNVRIDTQANNNREARGLPFTPYV